MALNMTQRELAEALDLNKNTVARAERDEIPIPRVTELAVKYLLITESRKKGRKNERFRKNFQTRLDLVDRVLPSRQRNPRIYPERKRKQSPEAA
jgi:transcriptional regulator with XRE-family HTH domain